MAMNSYANIEVARGTKQSVRDLHRKYPNAVLQRDETTYAAPVYHIIVDGNNQGMILNQDRVKSYDKLLDGATGTVQTLFERSQLANESF